MVKIRIGSLIGCLLPLLVQAANWPPYDMPYAPDAPEKFSPTFPPTGNYNFRPQPLDNSRNIAPLEYPEPYNYNRLHGHTTSPQFTVTIDKHKPYVRENVILTLRVISNSSIERMDPVLPQTQAVTFQILHNPIASNIFVNSQSQIVNEMRYMATPLMAGPVTLQFSINVTIANYIGQPNSSFTLQAPQTINLQVQPQIPNIIPWLPLEKLTLNSNINTLPEVVAGEPIELMLQLIAAGALGNQLPSLERLLKAADLRVYRGKTEWEGGPSQDLRHIMGTRTEHYTLVPQYSGTLRLPSVRIQWFNVKTAAIEYAELTDNELAITDLDSDVNVSKKFGLESSFGWLMITLLMLFMLTIGYWMGTGYQNPWQRFIIFNGLATILRPYLVSVAEKSRQEIRRLIPKPYLIRIAYRAFDTLPISIRFWFWVRSANIESNPILWRNTLQFLSGKVIANSPYITNPDLAERIMQFHSSANAEQLRRLLKILDAAIYGNQSIDFAIWKREFIQQIRPNLLTLWRELVISNKHVARLPPLNPNGA